MDYAIPEPALRILYFSAMKAGVLENEALFARLFHYPLFDFSNG
jgi:hypothetical protein